MLATALKPLARCLCPRCLITKDEISRAGTQRDKNIRTRRKRVDTEAVQSAIQAARRAIFNGRALSGKAVKNHLDPQSLNPIQVHISSFTPFITLILIYSQSAFSARLADFAVNFYDLFAPDIMHEFELGVWKGVFKHLMRLLERQGQSAVEEFNSR